MIEVTLLSRWVVGEDVLSGCHGVFVSLTADDALFPFRAIIIRSGEVIPMSSEFTPETERQRLQYLVRVPWVWQRVAVLGTVSELFERNTLL